MKLGVFILALFCAAVSWGQSGINNPPYKPQVRIKIPYIQPLETDGLAIIPVSNRYSFCDFNLKCIDQSGTRGRWRDDSYSVWIDTSYYIEGQVVLDYNNNVISITEPSYQRDGHFETIPGDHYYDPVIYEFDTRIAPFGPAADFNAACFYTDQDGNRKKFVWRDETNIVERFVWAPCHSNWNQVVSRATYPDRIYDNAGRIYVWLDPEILIPEPYSANVDQEWPVYYTGSGGADDIWFRGTNGLWGLADASEPPQPEPTNSSFLPQGWTSNTNNNAMRLVYGAITNVWPSGSLRTISGSDAYGITVYPSRDHPSYKYFNESVTDVRWVCSFWDGVKWLTNTVTGNPILFDVDVDYVTKTPE